MTTPASQTATREDYYARVAQKNLMPLWTAMADLVPKEPKPTCQPAYWSYRDDIRPYLVEAADLITAEEAERRVLVLNNPSIKRGATHTLICAIQLIKGGETAPAHRHSQAALRFVIEGEGAYTAVDGERTYMHPGDFIVTPAWSWHDHGKDNEGNMIWLDGLDVPLVNHLGATFSEEYPEPRYPQSRPPEDAQARYGSGILPLGPVPASAHSPVFNYPYTRTREALETLRRAEEWDTAHGLKVKYANPLNGDFALPTIASFAQLLPKGFQTIPYRSTESTVAIVAEGTGSAIVGDRTYALKQHDIFVVPNWTWWQLQASDDLVLLSFSDRATLQKLDLWREQRANEAARQ